MNTKFTQHLRNTFNYLDKHIRHITAIAIVFWLYHLGGAWIFAVIFTTLILIWQISKWIICNNAEKTVTNHTVEAIQELPIHESPKSEPLRNKIMHFIDKMRVRYAVMRPQKIAKAIFCLTAHTFLILFFIAIFLYNSDKITEPTIKIIAITSAIFYITLNILGINECAKTKEILKKWSDIPLVLKIRKISVHFFRQILTLNIYLFPIISFASFIILITSRSGIFLSDLPQKILTLLIFSTAFLLINTHTLKIRKGFLAVTGKYGAFLKTMTYIIIPAFLVIIILKDKPFDSITGYTISALITAGSIWLISSDTLYRKLSIPTLRRSSEALVSSYVKNLLRYGLGLIIIFLIIFGPSYFKDHNLKDIFTAQEDKPIELPIESPFADMTSGHWALRAMVDLYQKGIIAPDSDNMIYPDKILNKEEALPIIFAYFDIHTEDFTEQPRLSFSNIPRWQDERYNLFKTAYYLDLDDIAVNPTEVASKHYLVNAIGKLDGWLLEDNYEDIVAIAKEKGIISNADPDSMNQPVNLAILAQILYNL